MTSANPNPAAAEGSLALAPRTVVASWQEGDRPTVVTRPTLQVALGALWLLDGAPVASPVLPDIG
ncbi:MAG: hypothetical protein ACRDV8_07425 [Acidimicrobiales bacterium]